MSDAQQAPVIALDINQELFIDTVRSGHVVDDATVATEVTALERVGEAYVLDGAIVFTGTLKQVPADPATPDDVTTHVHQRLPFRLSVPARTQPRGIVNVASRISAWQLAVAGDNWLKIEADLQVSGLNGQRGFQFTCGSQEFGDPSFSPSSLVDATPLAPPVALQEPHPSAAAAPSEQLQTVDPLTAEFGFDAGDSEESTLEFTPSAQSVVPAAAYRQDGEAQNDLAHFDRAMDGQSVRSSGVGESSDSDESLAAELYELPREPLITFEFEHQMSGVAAENESNSMVPEPAQPAIPFSAARSFSDEGFAPHVGFVDVAEPRGGYRDGSQAVVQRAQPSVAAGASTPAEPQPVPQGDRSDAVDSKLWAFVDFNAPERAYTLRYVVVMEEESIHAVADRVGCHAADLMAVNHLVTEEVFVGQTLRLPAPTAKLGLRS